jgi:hypothetical protein
MASRGFCNSSSRSGGITTINICKSSKSSSYPTGSNYNGSGGNGSNGSSASTNKTWGELPHNSSQHAHNNYQAGANTNIKSVAGFHCHTDKELAFGILLSSLTDSPGPAPCEYKACSYDDAIQGILKAQYNNIVRDLFSASVNGKVVDVLIAKQIKDLNEKIIDNNSALRLK